MRQIFSVHTWPLFSILLVSEALLLFSAIYIGFLVSFAQINDLADISKFGPQSALFALILILMQFSFGLYNWEYCSKISQVFIRLLAAFFGGFIFLAVIFYIIPQTEIWRSALAVALPLGFVAVLATRLAFSRIPTKDYLKRRLLIVGTGDEAARIEHLERCGKAYRFICVAFINTNSKEPKVSSSKITEMPNSLSNCVATMSIDEIVIAVDDRRGTLPVQAFVDCRLAGTPVITHQTFFEREMGRVDLETLCPDWFVFSNGFSGGMLQQSIKRLFDVVLSLLIFCATAPILALAAFAIRLDSRGDIFFRQERVGLQGKPFVVLKLRTMKTDAERDGVPQWAKVKDPRVTRVGAFLRNTRIDEIPQLLNVLRGDMSIVGPRPERPYFVDRFCESIPFYAERHRVRPGLTGWAQISYPYGASEDDAKRKLEYDLYYLRHYSVIRDFLIILQTIQVVIWPNGAR